MKKLLLLLPALTFANTQFDCSFAHKLLTKEVNDGMKILELNLKERMAQSMRMQIHYAEMVMIKCDKSSKEFADGKYIYEGFTKR